MKKTSLDLLKLSFAQDEQKIKNYIIDSGIETIILEKNEIPADEFCNNIHKYMGENKSDTNYQSQI